MHLAQYNHQQIYLLLSNRHHPAAARHLTHLRLPHNRKDAAAHGRIYSERQTAIFHQWNEFRTLLID